MVTEDNPFIRFKNHVHRKVRRGTETIFSIASPLPYALPATQQGTPDSINTNPSQRSSSSSTMALSRDSEEPRSSIEDVYDWAVNSPYSPLNLQTLRQPTPKGAPPGWEGHFTFRDAFEDLLVAGNREPVPKMRSILLHKAQESENVFSQVTHVNDWVGWLGVLGYWHSYFNIHPEADSWEWGSSRFDRLTDQRFWFYPQGPNLWGPWAQYKSSLALDRPHPWTGKQVSSEERWAQFAKLILQGSLNTLLATDEHGEDDLDDEVRHSLWQNIKDRAAEVQKTTEASTEEDLYQWNAKAVEQTKPVSKLPEQQTLERKFADGSKVVQTTTSEERDGYIKATKKSQEFDAQGNLISESTETSSSRTWSAKVPGVGGSFSWTSSRESNRSGDMHGNENGPSTQTDHKDSRERGWFWTK
ncbi:hypothetical protein GGR57DRAFT_30509 [Xylariaceae sp. FL1272]|nr:hypothetical protein GGR57DRAFT_30509 [Xylariaceae sp. FL1272]